MRLEQSEIDAAYEFVTEDLDRSAQKPRFEKRLRPTYKRLIETAESNERITYSELADHANTDNRSYLSILLDAIAYIEEQRGNPPLTVLVVHAGDRRPADDFLELLDKPGITHEHESLTDDELIDEFIAEVHDWYEE